LGEREKTLKNTYIKVTLVLVKLFFYLIITIT